ncbi:uncharacterized protein K460DRAFT_182204 [Cucurbitaria berberidis CBS 394.84]|uniref:Uncharacterized protein n=1 Tax=Cucurbitaria berberidis CBS 394.84 TaxID=1168544 RepID=A0A9P4GB63_9PLEO|nr:uncharacterized protein K460DRAFT_182204 [Cucurbitaria berberidis CBS 394.84]KAF1842309.1 hypothetical protein K460DRAFT_182204 [Cucurbitaria berberidis CBS 394.84]
MHTQRPNYRVRIIKRRTLVRLAVSTVDSNRKKRISRPPLLNFKHCTLCRRCDDGSQSSPRKSSTRTPRPKLKPKCGNAPPNMYSAASLMCIWVSNAVQCRKSYKNRYRSVVSSF